MNHLTDADAAGDGVPGRPVAGVRPGGCPGRVGSACGIEQCCIEGHMGVGTIFGFFTENH